MRKTLIYILISLLFPLSAHANGHVREYNIKLVNSADNTPISDAHICYMANKGSDFYAISNNDGTAKLKVDDTEGIIAISKIGFTTLYMPVQTLNTSTTFSLKKDVFNIEQVVVTGQSKPTPVDSSIYRVKLITEEKIVQSGSVNLSDLLMSEANIRISTDLVLGSQIEMMGIGGEHVKTMIDGVPIIGRLDGNVDLSQVNLDNIQQVEVIEGPMSVIYGNNALAGTINLITKQNKHHSIQAGANAFAESVGRYIGNGNFSKRIGNHLVSLDGGYEYFRGVDFNKNTRSKDWKPKRLYRINTRYGWNKNNWNINTDLRLYKDRLHHMGNVNSTLAYDSYFFTDRYDINLNISKKWNEHNQIDIVSSYNHYNRSSQDFTKDLTTLGTTWYDKESTQKLDQKMVRAIYSSTIQPNLFSLQAGIDLNQEDMGGPRMADGSQTLEDYAAFLTIKYFLFKNFCLQPGIRAAYNSDYDAPLVYAINAKWNLSPSINWRASMAKGFRAPNLKELYYIFEDSNHKVYGNSHLEAESSLNYNTSLEFISSKSKHNWRVNVTAYYNDIENMITLIPDETNEKYLYQNIEAYESLGGDLDVKYNFKSIFQLRAGYGITGRMNSYSQTNSTNKFNISHDAFAGIKALEPKSKIKLALDYKYNGAIPYYYQNNNNDIIEVEQEAYHTMNASVSKPFSHRKLQVTLGCKNLFDVTSIKSGGSGGSAHGGGISNPISYGRTWFANIAYRFNKY